MKPRVVVGFKLCLLDISDGIRHSLLMTTSASASSGAARVISLGPRVATALDPENWAVTDLPVTPRLGALSLLSSRGSFWEAHALTVAFAIDSVGEYPLAVVGRLASQERLSRWFSNDEFLRYYRNQDLETSHSALIRAAELIESGLDRAALQDAQFGTVKIDYCVQHCGDDIRCLQQCLNS